MSAMCPDPDPAPVIRMRSPRGAAQRGFSIVSAIFLLVVLAALGAFMLTFSTAQHTTSAQDVLGARAYQAARAGIEWGAYQALSPIPCDTTSTLTLGGTLAGFTVTVECTPLPGPFTEGANTVNVYTITSTASLGTPASSTRVERQLRMTVGK